VLIGLEPVQHHPDRTVPERLRILRGHVSILSIKDRNETQGGSLDYRTPADVEAAYTHPTTTAPATV
ncbi:hypothetical protein, partial [Kocuria sp. NBRC 114282]|uniref:hypothetical protein n=1 Tax=Kocuria sp. NBRC 114282 TaxID=2994520 RepID=UPI0025566374